MCVCVCVCVLEEERKRKGKGKRWFGGKGRGRGESSINEIIMAHNTIQNIVVLKFDIDKQKVIARLQQKVICTRYFRWLDS